mgnify:CR=1 FL=1
MTVIGDFVFETKLPNYIFKMVQEKFESVRSIAEFNSKEMQTIIHQPGKTILTLTRGRSRAETIRNEIKKLFQTRKT